MRQFTTSGFRIWNLGIEAKLIYTGFGVLSLLAVLVSLLLYEDLVGLRAERVPAYYAGQTEAARGEEPERRGPAEGAPGDPRGGPVLELPEEPAAPITVAISYRKLLEVTHFHLFTLPIFLLVIAHLFMLTGLGTRAKTAWIVAGWGAATAHLAAPWLIRYLGAGLSPLYPLSGAILGLTLLVMIAYPILVMWWPPSARRR